MHLRHADGQVAAEIPPEPAKVLVRSGQRRHDKWRFRSIVRAEAAATGAVVVARLRLHPRLSLPRLAGRDAHQAGRHRPVQVRRVQGQRIDQAHQESRLLQEGPAAPRRHRIHHHYQPFHGRSRICLGQIRHDLPDRSVDPAAEGSQVAGAERGLRGRTDQRLDQHHRQLVLPAVRQSRYSPRAGAGARPQGLHLDHVRRTGRCRRHHAPGAGRPVGDAEGNAGIDSRAMAPISTPTGKRHAS